MQDIAGFFKGRAHRIAGTFVLQVAGAGLAFLFNIVLARLIGVAGVGVYFLAVTVAEISATISRLGLESAGMRFISIAHSRGDRGMMADLYRKCMGLAVLAGIAIAPAVWLIVSNSSLGGAKAAEFQMELPSLLLASVPMALLVIQADLLRGVGASATAVLVQSVLPPMLLLVACSVLWLRGLASLHAIVLSFVAVMFVAMGTAMLASNLRLPGLWREQGSFGTRRLLSASFPLLLVTGLTLVMGWTDTLVLGSWWDSGEVGIYGIALRISLMTSFVLNAVAIVVAPQFAALHAAGDLPALRRLGQQSTLFIIAAALPAVLVLIAVPNLILQIFGTQFKDGAWPLRILVLGQFANLAAGPVGILLLMTGHGKDLRNCIAVSAMLNLLMSLVMIPRYAAIGAATSTAISLAFANAACWQVVRKKLGINTLGSRP